MCRGKLAVRGGFFWLLKHTYDSPYPLGSKIRPSPSGDIWNLSKKGKIRFIFACVSKLFDGLQTGYSGLSYLKLLNLRDKLKGPSTASTYMKPWISLIWILARVIRWSPGTFKKIACCKSILLCEESGWLWFFCIFNKAPSIRNLRWFEEDFLIRNYTNSGGVGVRSDVGKQKHPDS